MKRETTGARIKRARREQRISAPALVKRIQEAGKKISVATIRALEAGATENPGVKTLERIAIGLYLDELEVINLSLDNPRDLTTGFKTAHFARLEKVYGLVRKDKKPLADELIKMLITHLELWR